MCIGQSGGQNDLFFTCALFSPLLDVQNKIRVTYIACEVILPLPTVCMCSLYRYSLQALGSFSSCFTAKQKKKLITRFKCTVSFTTATFLFVFPLGRKKVQKKKKLMIAGVLGNCYLKIKIGHLVKKDHVGKLYNPRNTFCFDKKRKIKISIFHFLQQIPPRIKLSCKKIKKSDCEEFRVERIRSGIRSTAHGWPQTRNRRNSHGVWWSPSCAWWRQQGKKNKTDFNVKRHTPSGLRLRKNNSPDWFWCEGLFSLFFFGDASLSLSLVVIYFSLECEHTLQKNIYIYSLMAGRIPQLAKKQAP